MIPADADPLPAVRIKSCEWPERVGEPYSRGAHAPRLCPIQFRERAHKTLPTTIRPIHRSARPVLRFLSCSYL